MIQNVVKGFIESGSFFDLLLIWIGYSLGWIINIYFACLFSKTAIPNRIHLITGAFLGYVCLEGKAYFPINIFPYMMTITLIFIFSLVSGLGFIKALASIISLSILTCASDYIIIQPLIKINPFIFMESWGIVIGTLLESIFPAISILLYRGVKKVWKMTKSRNPLQN